MIHQVKSALIESVADLYARLFLFDAETTSPGTSREESDLVSETRLSGAIEGTVHIRFPRATARRLLVLLTGFEGESTEGELIDVVGELTEMIIAGARGRLGPARVTASKPSVRCGRLPEREHDGSEPKRACWCMTSDCGGIDIDAMVRSAPALRYESNQSRAAA